MATVIGKRSTSGKISRVNEWRYWRMIDYATPGGINVEISEIEFRKNGVNVVPDGEYSFSNVWNLGGDSLFDGLTSTRDGTPEDPTKWIKLDLGTANTNGQPIDSVVIGAWDNSTRFTDAFTFECSKDDITWYHVKSPSGISYPGNKTLSSPVDVSNTEIIYDRSLV